MVVVPFNGAIGQIKHDPWRYALNMRITEHHVVTLSVSLRVLCEAIKTFCRPWNTCVKRNPKGSKPEIKNNQP